MTLGFDAKRYFHNHTGLGNYSRTILKNLHRFYPENQYHLFTPKIGNSTYPKNNFIIQEYAKRTAAIQRSLHLSNRWDKLGLQIYHGLSNELPFFNRSKTKTVLTVHDLIFKTLPETYPYIDRVIYNKKLKISCQTADKIIAISKHTKKDICKYYEIEASKITVLYQAVADVFYQDNDLGLSLPFTNNQLPSEYILCVGTLQTRKNQLQILKAWRALPTSLQLPIVLIGKGNNYQKKLQTFAQTHKIPLHCLTSIESNKELKAMYQKASVFVYPSLYEGFGLPIVEAMLSGVPVITSDVSAMPEAGGLSAKYIDPLNIEALANSLEQVLKDKELRKQMILKGRKYAMTTFDPAYLSRSLMKVYQEVLSKP